MSERFIPVHRVSKPVNLRSLPDEYWTSIASDWAGQPLSFHWRFFLAYDEKLFQFFTKSSAPVHLAPDSENGEFTAELWKYTVAEIFFFNASTDSYQEFNIAPNGAWWNAKFSSYREEEESHPPEYLQLTPLANRTERRWITGFSLPLNNIVSPFSLEKLRINVCGIAGESDQTFLSYTSLPEQKPDFHLKELGAEVRVIDLQA